MIYANLIVIVEHGYHVFGIPLVGVLVVLKTVPEQIEISFLIKGFGVAGALFSFCQVFRVCQEYH